MPIIAKDRQGLLSVPPQFWRNKKLRYGDRQIPILSSRPAARPTARHARAHLTSCMRPHAGDLIIEGGGFCGARTAPLNLDLSAYDGVTLRVRGDGQTFKLNIKTVGGGL